MKNVVLSKKNANIKQSCTTVLVADEN